MRSGMETISAGCLIAQRLCSCRSGGLRPPDCVRVASRTWFPGFWARVLGGHYTFFGSRIGRLREFVAKGVLRDLDVENPVSTAVELRALLHHQFGFRGGFLMRRDFWRDNEQEIRSGVDEDIEATIRRYVARGITSVGAIREAYITEHRGIQMICQQPLTAQADVDISAPFGRRALMELATSIPASTRIHNKLSQALLKRYYPNLLSLPTAATPFRRGHLSSDKRWEGWHDWVWTVVRNRVHSHTREVVACARVWMVELRGGMAIDSAPVRYVWGSSVGRDRSACHSSPHRPSRRLS